jgi:hypothetical protein
MQRPADDVAKVFLGMAPEIASEACIEGHRHEFVFDHVGTAKVTGGNDGGP